jgi:hypothetical protein
LGWKTNFGITLAVSLKMANALKTLTIKINLQTRLRAAFLPENEISKFYN